MIYYNDEKAGCQLVLFRPITTKPRRMDTMEFKWLNEGEIKEVESEYISIGKKTVKNIRAGM
jgi:hypothetical protein